MNRYLILVFVTALIGGCATIYSSPDLDRREKKHKQIAIVPIESTIKYNKLPKGVTIEQIEDMEIDMTYQFQDQLYIRFLKRSTEYRIDFQDVEKTNLLLEKQGISGSNISQYSKAELAEILGVDALISGKIISTKPMSTGTAIAVGVIFGVWGTTNQVDVTLSVHDGADSELIWKYNHVYSGSVGSTPENLTKELMKQIARKFPYQLK